MERLHDWLWYILPAPILYLLSVIAAGVVLGLLLRNQKPRTPSLLATWLGATLAALVPQVLYVFISTMLEEDLMVVFPIIGFLAGAVLVILCLRRVFGTTTGRAIAMYAVCLGFQALAFVPLYFIYRPLLMPAFYVYCILLIVSLPIFLAFRRFTVP
jgi:hypothetical protein